MIVIFFVILVIVNGVVAGAVWKRKKWKETEKKKMKEKATHDDQQFSTGRSLRPVLNIDAFNTDELVPGGKPVLTGGFHPVLAWNFLAVSPFPLFFPS